MELSVTIPQIKVKDIAAVLKEQYNIEPQQELTITFLVKSSTSNLPPYDVPKQYPEEIKELVKRAKEKAKEKQKQGYSREQAFQDIFKIQEKIAKKISE